MWIARPIYELIPYVYMAVGAGLIAAAWFLTTDTVPGILAALGSISLLAGIVLWLRRKDYRTRQSEYNSHSLDD